MSSNHIKIITENRKARHNYFIEDTYEAGMVLLGTEVKSLRLGRVNLKDSYARIKKAKCLFTRSISVHILLLFMEITTL